jgi:hypothetical protein
MENQTGRHDWIENPVILVIRTSDSQIRWMNVTDYLRRHGKNTKQIVFEGEPFTALNVARMREKVVKRETQCVKHNE